MPFLTNYNYRAKLTIDQTKIDSTLTNFPVPVFLNDANFEFANAESDGSDIVFTSSDGETLIPFEREFHGPINSYGSDVLTGGTASASEDNGTNTPNLAVDNNDSTFWATNPSTLPLSWAYDLGSGITKTVRQLRLKPFRNGGGAYVKDFTIYGSNNASPDVDNDGDWTSISTHQHADTDAYENYEFANSTAYRHYRIKVTTNWRAFQDAGIYEVEMMELSGSVNEAYYWVKIPSISDSVDTDFYIYYNPDSGIGDSEDPTNVWDSNHVGVWHLKESGNGTTDEFIDSTTFANHGTGNAVPTQVDSVIYKGQTFSSDRIRIDDDSDLEFGSANFTWSLKVKFNAFGSNYAILARDTDGNGYFYLGSDDGTSLRFRDYSSGDVITFTIATPGFSTGVQYDLEIERVGTTITIYKDGVSIGSGTSISAALTNRAEGWDFGQNATIAYAFNGELDEIRFSNTNRGAAWRDARIDGDNDDLLTYGSEEIAGTQVENVDITIVSVMTETDIQTYNAESLALTIIATITASDSLAGGPADFGSKILSYNPLIFITNTSPANIVKVDITDPENPTWETEEIIGVINLVDATLDTINEFVYAVGDDGLIVKVNLNDLSDQTIIDLDDSDNLLTIDIDEDNGLVYIGTENSIGELYVLDNRETFIGDTDLQILTENQFIGDTSFNSINGFIGDCNLQVLGQETFIGDCDFKCLTQVLDDIIPLKQTDFVIFIDNVQLHDTDVDLSSIRITHTVDEKSTATFKLNRRHDKVNTDLQGNTRTITNNNEVRIEIDGVVEFPKNSEGTGRVANINSQYGQTEGIVITAKSETPSYNYNGINLSLPSVTGRLGLYEVLVSNPIIENEYIDPDEINPKKYKGIKIPFGKKIEQSVERFLDPDAFGTLANEIQNGTAHLRQLRTYFWSPSVVRFGDFNVNEENRTPTVTITNPFHGITLPVFKLPDNFAGGGPQNPLVDGFGTSSGKTSAIFFSYIGTSLAPVSEDLWILRNAKHRWQRIFPDIITRIGDGKITLADLENLNLGVSASAVFSELQTRLYIDGSGNILVGFKNIVFKPEDMVISYSKNVKNMVYDLMDNSFAYYLGSAPYKQVSTVNGILVPKSKYEDRDDGLYSVIDASYNYTGLITKVADLEYQKLLNINGDIYPDTSCTLNLTIDGYFYFDLRLLNRFNIDNTINANEFKNNNGFPLAIKSITVDSNLMEVIINGDNKKSTPELEEIDGQYPNDDSDEFINDEQVTLIATKSDMNTRLKIE